MASSAGIPNLSMFAPPQLDPLPTVKTETPAYIPPTTEQLSPDAGWAGTGGQIANIAANFLHGWMAGKELAQQKSREQANQKLSAAWTAYNTAMQVAGNENLPLEQRQRAAATLPGLKGLYLDQVRLYSGGGEGKGKKSSKSSGGGAAPAAPTMNLDSLPINGETIPISPTPVGGSGGAPAAAAPAAGATPQQGPNALQRFAAGLMRAIVPQKPEMFASGMADLLQGALPDSMPLANPARAAAIKEMEQRVQRGQQEVDLGSMSLGVQKRIAKMHEDYDQTAAEYARLKAANPNDPQLKVLDADLHAQKGALGGYGVKVMTPGELETDQGREDFERLATQQKMEAIQTVAAGKPLSWWQQTLLGTAPKGVEDVYLQNVGPDKRFKDTMQAIQQMQADQAAMYQTIYGGRTPMGQIERQIQIEHPEWTPQQVADEALRRYKPTPEEKATARTGSGGKSLAGMSQSQLQKLQEDTWRKVIVNDPTLAKYFSKTDSKGKTTYGPTPGPTGLFSTEKKRTDWSGYQQRGLEMAKQILASEGYDDATITKIIGGYGQMPAQGPQAMSPTPGAQGGSPGQTKRYTVTDSSGKSEVLALTDEQAALAKAQNLTVEPVKSTGAHK